MQAAVDGKLLISICAGVTLDQLKSYVPQGTMCIRAMPNTPSKASCRRNRRKSSAANHPARRSAKA